MFTGAVGCRLPVESLSQLGCVLKLELGRIDAGTGRVGKASCERNVVVAAFATLSVDKKCARFRALAVELMMLG